MSPASGALAGVVGAHASISLPATFQQVSSERDLPIWEKEVKTRKRAHCLTRNQPVEKSSLVYPTREEQERLYESQ